MRIEQRQHAYLASGLTLLANPKPALIFKPSAGQVGQKTRMAAGHSLYKTVTRREPHLQMPQKKVPGVQAQPYTALLDQEFLHDKSAPAWMVNFFDLIDQKLPPKNQPN